MMGLGFLRDNATWLRAAALDMGKQGILADRDVGLAPPQIERVVRRDQIDLDPGLLEAKSRDDRRQEKCRDDLAGRDGDRPAIDCDCPEVANDTRPAASACG